MVSSQVLSYGPNSFIKIWMIGLYISGNSLYCLTQLRIVQRCYTTMDLFFGFEMIFVLILLTILLMCPTNQGQNITDGKYIILFTLTILDIDSMINRFSLVIFWCVEPSKSVQYSSSNSCIFLKTLSKKRFLRNSDLTLIMHNNHSKTK